MAENHSSDDLLEQLFGMTTGAQPPSSSPPTMLQISSGDGVGGGGYRRSSFPVEVILNQGRANAFTRRDEASGSSMKTLRRERIAERIRALQELVPGVNKLRRERIAERIRALQELVPGVNKVLRMSTLGGAGAVAPLVTNIPISLIEGEGSDGGRNPPAWDRWLTDGTERQVAKLMEENIGAAMQFLQTKALCIVPISLASAIHHTQPQDTTTYVEP